MKVSLKSITVVMPVLLLLIFTGCIIEHQEIPLVGMKTV